jgi:Rieske Fe-S protein
MDQAGERTPWTISFAVDHAKVGDPKAKYLQLSMTVGHKVFTVEDNWFEDGMQRLERELPENLTFVCCLTCLFSDYSPAGNGLLGMPYVSGLSETPATENLPS